MQWNTLQPSCSVLLAQRHTDRPNIYRPREEGLICLQGSLRTLAFKKLFSWCDLDHLLAGHWKAKKQLQTFCLILGCKPFFSSELFGSAMAIPVQRWRWIAPVHMVTAVQWDCMDMGVIRSATFIRRSGCVPDALFFSHKQIREDQMWKGLLNRRRLDYHPGPWCCLLLLFILGKSSERQWNFSEKKKASVTE